MARLHGSQNKMTKDIKEVLHLAFARSGGVDYLCRVADEDPKTFCALLGKCIPTQVALDVQIQLNLGAEMLAAKERLDRINNQNVQTIDITPDAPITAPPKSLITKDS